MKNLLILAMAAVHGLYGADVTVNLDGTGLVPMKSLARAKKVASAMFSEIGISIRWTSVKPQPGKGACPAQNQVIEMLFTDRQAELDKRLELARALPYASGGTRVTVFYDRSLLDERPALLAHVLAHEIGHVLQGISRHSRTGVMKATWTKEDRYDMESKPLKFAPDDAELIRSALARRSGGSCAETLVAAR